MAGLQLPNKFIPTHKAVQATLSAHATGPIELFLLACNIETDISLDERLAQRGYRAVIDENAKKNAAAAGAGEHKNEEEPRYPFVVPVTLPVSSSSSREKAQGMDID